MNNIDTTPKDIETMSPNVFEKNVLIKQNEKFLKLLQQYEEKLLKGKNINERKQGSR